MFLSLNSHAQFVQPKFGRLTVDDGLSGFRVYDILQDKKGFLWFATVDGLDRYDGYHFKVFRHKSEDAASISDNVVTALCEDQTGSLWIGTRDGVLNRFDRITETFTHFHHDPVNQNSISGFPISSLHMDKGGNLWIGTLGGGLGRIDASLLNDYRHDKIVCSHFREDKSGHHGLSSNKVYALAEDDSLRLYIGTDNGLNVYSQGRFFSLNHAPLNPYTLCSDTVVSIHVGLTGGIWIATARGLSFLDHQTWEFTNYKHDPDNSTTLSYGFVTCVAEENERYVWVGTQVGLNRLNRLTGTCTRYLNDPVDPSSLLNDYVIKTEYDNAGNLWIATDRGLSKVAKRTSFFVHYLHDRDRFASQAVHAICQDRFGDLWVGTTQGVKRFRHGTNIMTTYKNDPADKRTIGPGKVQAIVEDEPGGVWIGTLGGGLNRFDSTTKSFAHFEWAPAGSGNRVMALCKDSFGMLWVGTLGEGLVRIDPETKEIEQFLHDNENPQSISNNTVVSLLLDGNSNLWIGTEGGGLNLISTRSPSSKLRAFACYRHEPGNVHSLGNDRVYSLGIDRKGRLWIGTGNGLDMFEKETETFKHYFGENFSGVALSIVEDNDGKLWLATIQNGIYRIDPDREELIHFDVHDGLQSDRFYYASHKSRKGMLFFGGEKGFNAFQPESIRVDTPPGGPSLTEFRLFDKPMQLDSSISEISQIELRYDQNYFSFEFSSLDFTMPAKNRYFYKLEGLDKDWTRAGTRPYAPYTNVDPGDYVFRVKGTNNDGMWKPNEAAITLIITPPYWATWWFRVLIGATLLAIAIMIYRYRIARLLEIERVRMRIATDLHDDVGSNLGSIALTSDMIQSSRAIGETERRQLLEISTKARRTAEALRDVVWVIQPEHDKLDTLILKLRDEAASLLKNIEYSFSCPAFDSRVPRDIEFGRNVLLIYKELLHNVAKSAKATKVDISFAIDGETFVMRIADNGVGFDPEAAHRGLGLRSVKDRAGTLGGSVNITSSHDGGTIVEVRVKIP